MAVKQTPIGTLRHRITFQSLSLTPDGQGGFTETWTDFKTVWAKVEPVKAWERVFAQHLESQRSHKITIRYLEGVVEEMRIIFGTRTFQVKGVRAPEERSFYLLIDAEENVGS